MRTIHMVVIASLILMGTGSFANPNALKYVPGVKLGKGVMALMNEVEYERHLIPFTTGYIRLGGANFDVPGTDSVQAEFRNAGVGIRYNLLLLTIGTGFEISQVTLEDTVLGTQANGTISGVVVDVGKSFGLGPLSVGTRIGVQLAKHQIDQVGLNLGDLSGNASGVMVKFECHAGYHF